MRSPTSCRWAVLLATAATACGPSPADELGFGGTVGAESFVISAPADPMPVAPPVLTPCPSGWQPAGAFCAPWAAGAAACPEGQARFPDQPSCERIGAACPAGEWAADLPSGATVLYVRAGAVGGSGTQAAPFGAIAQAMNVAIAGTVIALPKATFDEMIMVKAGVTLWGACVEGTTLTRSSTTGGGGVITLTGPGSAARELRVRGGRKPAVWVNNVGAEVDLHDVEVIRAEQFGLAVVGGKAKADRLVIRETQPDSATNDLGVGAFISRGGTFEATQLVIDRSKSGGVITDGAGTSATLDRVAVLSTESSLATRSFGHGALALGGSTMRITASIFEGNQSSGIDASGGTVQATDLLVRGSLPNASGEAGVGMLAEMGGTITCGRCAMVENTYSGVRAQNPGSTITVTDLVVAATRSNPTQGGGYGIDLLSGSALTGTRVSVEDGFSSGISARGAGTRLELTDVSVRRVASEVSSKRYGNGIVVAEGATAVLSRVDIADSHAAGLLAAGAGTSVQVSDLVMARITRSTATEHEAGGFWGQEGAKLRLSRGRFEEIEIISVAAMDPMTEIIAEDLRISDTRSLAVSGYAGFGIGAQLGSRIEVTRVAISGSRAQGVMARDPGTKLVASQIAVRDTAPPRCTTDKTCGEFGGTGFSSVLSASMQLTHFISDKNATGCGVQLAVGGTVDLSDGVISGNLIGLNIQDTDFDLGRLQQQTLRFYGNTRAYDGAMLPLPSLDFMRH